jgi:lambda family phage portal protein
MRWPFAKRAEAPMPVKRAVRSFRGLDYGSSRAEADLSVQIARGELSLLRRLSRDAEQNSAPVQRWLGLLEVNVLGPKGIRFESLADGDKDREVVTALWLRWGESASLDGGLTWTEFAALALRSAARDGEAFVRKHSAELALEILDPAVFEEGFEGKGPEGRIRQSIETDTDGRPVAYWANPGTGAPRIRIPAGEILHLFRRTRPGQLRGVPWAAPVLDSLSLLRRYKIAELRAAIAQSEQIGFLTEDVDADLGIDDDEDALPPIDLHLGDAGSTRVLELPAGKKFEAMPANHPSSGFSSFVAATRDEVAAGLGVAGFSLSSSYAEVNFSAGRIGLDLERDQYRTLQAWLIRNLHRPVYLWWLDRESLSLESPIRLRAPFFRNHKWVPRGFPSIRPQEEAATNKEELQQGTTSITRILAERGTSVESVIEERRRESEAFKAAGLPDPHRGAP